MRKSHLFPSWLFRSLAALVAAASALSSLQAQTVPVNFASGTATAATGQALATTWQTQTFGKTFAAAPVVVMGPAFSADGQPHAVRVRSVSTTQFQWQIDEWDYLAGDHTGTITLSWFAMSEGNHLLGTQRWQVGRVTNANRANSVVPLTGFDIAPTVLAQVYDVTNFKVPSTDPKALKTRISAVTATNFTFNLETQQLDVGAITNESVGYIAVSYGTGYLDGKVLWSYNPGTVGNTLKTFYAGPFTNPAILAQTQTALDSDPGDIRLSSLPSLVNGQTRIQMVFQEEISSDANTTHSQEVVGALFIGDMPGEAAAKFVTGNISVAQPTTNPNAWTKVNLAATYTAPVVIAGPASFVNSVAASVRVRNVVAADPANAGRTSFEVQVDEWDFQDNIHSTETVSYMVMEEGTFAIGGQVIEAKRVSGVTNAPQTISTTNTFWAADIFYEREPAIFSQCVTVNEASAVVARVDSIDTLNSYPPSFRLRLTEAENADQTHAAETVHCIIIPAGQGRFISSGGLRGFCAGVTNSLSSTASTVSFPTKFATPTFFGAVQGDASTTIAVDGYYGTAVASDLDPVTVRRTALDAASATWLAEEDASPGAANNTHGVEVGAWFVVQQETDTDADGISDAAETRMGTSTTSATSLTNASDGTASDWDTWVSLNSLNAVVSQGNIFEVMDRAANPQVLQRGVVTVTRTGTMKLNTRVSIHNGTSTAGRGNASPSDFSLTIQAASATRGALALSGAIGTLQINANQGTSATPIVFDLTPVIDNVMEVPESLRVTFGNIPTGINGQDIARHTYYTLRDAVGSNPNNRTLYVAYLTKAAGTVTTAAGVATALLEGDNAIARVNVDADGLSSGYVNAYIRTHPGGVDLRNNLSAAPPPIVNVQWDFLAAGTYTTDQGLLDGLNSGGVRCDIGTATYGAGEIRGIFNKTTGYQVFDAARPDLIQPILPGSLTLSQAVRDIYRFMDQSTFGATADLFTQIKAKVDAIDPLDPNPLTPGEAGEGCTSANLIAGYTAWINEQMNPTTTPNPNFLTLVMAADNEEFLMRGSKPLWAGNDQQFAGAGYTASYDAFGNVTNPYVNATNNAFSFNAPQNSANRRREWWTLVLQAKAQLRQRMALALSEILVISEADTNVNTRHYGAARYWDMLAEGAFGKYRTLLEQVTYSPMMGTYLSHLRNRAQYSSGGVTIFPDENYAREIMQLFSVGLVQRHPDGALILSSTGLPIPTYDQADITELARVMTGLCHGARHASVPVTRNSTAGYQLITANQLVGQVEFQGVNFTDFASGAGEAFYQAPWLYPMKALGRFNGISYHDFGAKTLFNGKAGQAVIPSQNLAGLSDLQTHALADTDLRLAHNALAGDPTSNTTYNGHPTTPQFISRQLIQRLVTSNPTAGYIYRVSQKWRTTNGNLGEVMKAILLDYEARSLTMADSDPVAGKLKEPLVQFSSFLRALKPKSGAELGVLSAMSTGFSGADSPMLGAYPSGELAKFAPTTPTRLRFSDMTTVIGQSPQRAPSVFNWFLPDYIQPGPMAEAGLFGPELQINTESMLVNRVNRHYSIALMGVTGGTPGFGLDDFTTNSANMAARLVTDVQTLTFNSSNWDTAQTVTVYGLENTLDDGTRTSSISHQVASGDPNFSNTYSAPINFTLNDNDSIPAKLVAITQTGNGTLALEGGTPDTYKVVLTTAPTANVTIAPSAVQPWQLGTAVTSTDVTVFPAITFTTANWNVPQNITVTAVNDAVANSYLVANAPHGVRTAMIRHTITSADPGYNGSQVSDITCTVQDNDFAPNRRFIPTKATATGIAVVTENTTTDTYTVGFGQASTHMPITPPTADVVLSMTYDAARVTIASTDPTFTNSGGVATLTFNASNYTTARTITIGAVNDATFQGVQFRDIVHSTTSTDANYNAVPCAPMRVRVNDNDSAATNGISIVQTWGSTAAVENGMSDTYHVVLNRAPTSNVGLTWFGTDGDVAGVGNLTFTTANWFVPQTVTVSGRNDLRVETTQLSLIRYVAAGGGYTASTTLNVSVGDDDLNSAAGVIVAETSGTAVTEGSSADTYTVRLAGAPNNDVVITASANSQLTLSVMPLTFTPQNWNTPQTVSVTAFNDTVVEGPHSSTITTNVTSADNRYHNFPVADISVNITDNDTGARIVLAHTSGVTAVTEGGATDTISVSLAGPTAPTANVAVTLTGNSQLSLGTSTLTFTPANWTTTQNVTVTAINDTSSEVPLVSAIAAATNASQPAGFTSLSATIAADVYDNDELGNNGVNGSSTISFIQTNGSTRVVEGGMTDTVGVVLRKAPTGDVVLVPSYSVDGQMSLNTGALTFTPANWNVPQNVTITATDDALVEGPQNVNLILTSSATGGYLSTNAVALGVAIGDNEANNPMVTITGAGGASVTEGGATYTYTVVLGAAPLTGASVRVTPNPYFANAFDSSHVTFNPTSVTFTSTDWNTPKSIIVTATDNALAEAAITSAFTILHTTSMAAGTDIRYNGMVANDIVASVLDNDTGARIVMNETGGNTLVTEGANTDTVAVSFTGGTAPASNVVVTLTGTAQASVSPATLTFTPANWTTPQNITITAINDVFQDAPTFDSIVASTDALQPIGFTTLSSRVVATVLDNDEQSAVTAISVIQTNGATRVIEGGLTDSAEIVLRRAPTANVVVTPSYSVAGQIVTGATSYTFTPSNWNVPQLVTITATDDVVVEGAQTVNLIFTAGATGGYILADTVLITVAVGDNEAANPAVNITPPGSLAVTEGTPTSYSVTLNAAPAAGSTVRVTPSAFLLNAGTSQVTFSPTSVSFTTANWSVPQAITVTAVDDAVAEVAYADGLTIVNSTSIVGGTDNRYNGMVGPDLVLTLGDNDSAVGRIHVAHTGGSTALTEDAGTETVEVSLVGPTPAANVTVNLARLGSDFRYFVNGNALDTTTLTFTPANFTTPQTVDLIVIPDTGSEGVEVDTISATSAAGSPAGYSGLTTTLPIRVLDSDDLPRTLINILQTGEITRIVEGGATDTVRVVLRRAPTANVILTASYNTAQVSLSSPTLTFTSTNWNVPQTLTVSAVDDLELENTHSAPITFIASQSGGYWPTDTAAFTALIGDNEAVGTGLITAAESGGQTWLVESTTATATDNYTLVLGSAPTAPVTITPKVNDNVGTNDITFSPPSVTFTSTDWSTPKNIVINLAANSANSAGARPAAFIGHVVTSNDQHYRSALTPTVNAIISDASDSFTAATAPGVAVVPTGGVTSVHEGASGNTDTVYIFLKKKPAVGATITVTPTLNTSASPHTVITGQVTFTPATLAFTDTNWNTPQLLTITAVTNTTAEPQLTAALICTPSVGTGFAVTNTNVSLLTSPAAAPVPVTVYDDDLAGKIVISQPTTSVLEGGAATYTVKLNSAPAAGQTVTITIVTQKHVVPSSSHALEYNYFSAAATNSNMQKDNLLFDWSELTTIYNNAYHLDRGAAIESTATAPNGHLAGSKAIIDRLDELWGGGQMKAKWPDGVPATNNPRDLLSIAIQNCYSLTRLSNAGQTWTDEVLNRCRFAAHLVSISPTAVVSH